MTATVSYGVLLCKFADKPLQPRPASDYAELMNHSAPNIGHYWSDVSYGRMTLESEVSGWHILPNTYDHYVPDYSKPRYQELSRDCRGAALGVDPAQFDGLIYWFNAPLLSAATAYPPQAFIEDPGGVWDRHGVTAHEMGHTFGFPHSRNSTGHPSSWDLMGYISPVCGGETCVPVHPIAEWKRAAGWIRLKEVFRPRPGTVTTISLDPLSAPSMADGHFRMAQVFLDGTMTRYFTVEVRKRDGYDDTLPTDGVVIHRFTLREGYETADLVERRDSSDRETPGAWTIGDELVHSRSGLRVKISRAQSDGAVRVKIRAPQFQPRVVLRKLTAGSGRSGSPDALGLGKPFWYIGARAISKSEACYDSVPIHLLRDTNRGWRHVMTKRTSSTGSVAFFDDPEEDRPPDGAYRVLVREKRSPWVICPRAHYPVSYQAERP